MPRIDLGQVVITPGATDALDAAAARAIDYLRRHQAGDWGSVSPDDWALNNEMSLHGEALSAYILPDGVKIWIKTDPEAAGPGLNATTILLPSEY